MKVNKYYLLSTSFVFFTICSYVLYLKYVKAKELEMQDGGIQVGYDALNLEILLTVFPPIIIVIHLVVFIICKIKDKKETENH